MAKLNRSWKVPCPPQLVWDTATDLEHTSWRSDLTKVEVISPTEFIEYDREGGVCRMTVAVSEPCRRQVLQVEGRATYGTRELLLDWDGKETTITVKDEMMGRTLFVSLAEKGYLKEFQKRYLRELNNELHRIVYGD